MGKLQHEWRTYRTKLAAQGGVQQEAVLLMQAAFYVGAMAMFVILGASDREFPRLLIQYVNGICVKATKRAPQQESSV